MWVRNSLAGRSASLPPFEVSKNLEKLPRSIQEKAINLFKQLEISGPIQTSYPNFSKLKGETVETYHCHLKKGKPTYVAVWKVKETTITVQYIGTHENAPY
jgi:mRNA-degrading endonuclease YafQ of YafQ-DinJ toxin-antitoxin module